MVLFNCTTCSTACEDAEMLKHLATTRHKTLVHVPSQTTLECDNCQDTNIHQLVIIRYGGSDIEMLCQSCLAKEGGDKPSTQYTEQNGAILKYYERYLKVAELECNLCGNESNLSVDVNNTNFVVCAKCIREGGLDEGRKFIKESAPDFLYLFLGIKEAVKPTAKKATRSRKLGRGRKDGRDNGRGKGRGGATSGGDKPAARSGKPSNTSKVIIPTENVASLRSFKSLTKPEFNKIKPADDVHTGQARKVDLAKSRPTSSSKSGKNQAQSKGKGQQGKPSNGKKYDSPKPQQRQQVSGSKTNNPNDSSKLPMSSPSPVSAASPAPKSNNSTKKSESKPKDTVKRKSDDNSSKDNKDNSKEKKDAKKDNNKKTEIKKEQTHSSTSTSAPPKDQSKKEKSTKQPKDHKSSNKSSSVPQQQNTSSNGKGKDINKNKKDQKSNGKDYKSKSKDSKPDNKNKQQSKQPPQSTPIPEAEEVEEYEHIPKYQSKQPQLRYDNLSQYFKEMCSHLFLEQKLDCPPISKYYPDWTTSRSVFKVTVPNDEDIQSLVPEKLRALGKAPFQINQGIFITRDGDNDHVWSAFIRDMEPIYKHKKSKTVTEYDLLLELFKWEDVNEWPYGSSNLRITPCSVPISRILLAMARLDNKSFIKMLLGQEQIKQLYFNNRLQFSNDSLNQSQKVAIEHVLNNPITVLQGPPGTGKTSTIYEIIIQLIRNLRTFPIMVVAASNVAVDNIAEKLKAHTDLKTLRITSQEKEREYNESHPLADICLHHQVESHLPQNIKDIGRSLRYGEKVSQTGYKKYLTAKISTVDRLVAQAQIILTTTVTAGGLALKNVAKIPVVIMDEATQSNEASTLIPLSVPGVTKFLFVGDQKQLSSFSDVPYLEQSLFERVLLNETYETPHMLDTQYRMHPAISAFPIAEFYDGKLKDGVTVEQKTKEGVEPLVFIDTKGKLNELRVRNRGFNNGATYVNHGEAAIIVKLIKRLVFVKNVNLDKISIITPYSAQRDLLASAIQQDQDLNPNGEQIAEEVDDESGLTRKRPSTVKTILGVMISSIDAFQGREQEIVIFSCVRSNAQNNIGFVRDRRRLNVALTRAKNSLWLVGDKSCLEKGDPLWGKYMVYLERENRVVEECKVFEETS